MTLRVKLEIVPFGREEKAREIGRLDINNVGECMFHQFVGSECQYSVIMLEPERNYAGMFPNTVSHFRSEGAWALLKKVLIDLEIWRLK